MTERAEFAAILTIIQNRINDCAGEVQLLRMHPHCNSLCLYCKQQAESKVAVEG